MAIDIAAQFGLRHEIIHTSELERPEYRANPANRCYYCKHELYTHLTRIAADRHARSSSTATTPTIAATIGRAVRRRASSASAARSTKWISEGRNPRAVADRAGLPTWDEPASACLSSRIPYHSEVTDEKLRMIEARASRRCARSGSASAACGTTTTSRASRSGAPSWRARSKPEVGAAIVRELKAIGYRHVTIDLQGYRTGSLNEGLLLAAGVMHERRGVGP